ncbi:hypothetical protein ONZ45_g7485 [Pleurotus djamor]|nr:hypothetical protein ONZ45_g7485 [Pleurotus djamor]
MRPNNLSNMQPAIPQGFQEGPGYSKRPQKRSITPRTRKSPVIGPSPLRVMTLPEVPSSDQCTEKVGIAPPTLSGDRPQSALSQGKGDEDENALIGIIQELIEETSDWDPSLFMQPSFKSLLADTSVIREGNSNDAANTSNGSSSGPDTSSGSSNHSGSEEMDLSLLGVEFIRNQVNEQRPVERSQRNDGLVSFWDDKGWGSITSCSNPSSVGLAV